MKNGRLVFRVRRSKKAKAWRVTWPKALGGGALDFQRKADALLAAREAGRQYWRDGRPSQVVVHSRTGRIQTEWTYGRDPRRSKG